MTLASKDVALMRGLIKTIADRSGGTWIDVLRQREFGRFATALREKALHVDVSTDLCFGQGAQSRQIGLFLFAESEAARLDPAAVESATATQVELLLLEAQRRHIAPKALARLHGCLTARVEQLGEELHELFYEEMARQCINTHDYRSTLSSVTDHWYVAEILADVNARLAEIQQASVSTALQIEAPGQARAGMLEAQRLSRTVAKGVKDQSVFLNFVHTVHLLYGGDRWRMFDSNGSLGQASQMHMTSSTVEVPRLEFQDPEGMYIRRVMASARIASLEPLEYTTAAAPGDHEA